MKFDIEELLSNVHTSTFFLLQFIPFIHVPNPS